MQTSGEGAAYPASVSVGTDRLLPIPGSHCVDRPVDASDLWQMCYKNEERERLNESGHDRA